MALFGNKKNDSAKKSADSNKKAPAVKTVKEDGSSMADLYENKTVKKTSAKEVKTDKVVKSELANILVKPLVTEKASRLASENKYAFIVSLGANKISVAKAVKAIYGVNVLKVNIIKMEGKAVLRGRIKGRRSDFKKAIVTLKKGETISIYEGV
jgi:large subunit ribosomal protein L23